MPAGGERADGRVRVMVVDDSVVVRTLIARMLSEEPDLTVVATAVNGRIAVERLSRTAVDVVVLDIEMPVMDGLTALPKLREADPKVKIIMASTLTLRNADISIEALKLGAADYVPKPSSAESLKPGGEFHRELTAKVRALGKARRRPAPAAGAPPPAAQGSGSAPIALRKPGLLRPSVLAIGSSTGGPAALFALLGGLKTETKLPILITQHMPPMFTTILAEHISKSTGKPCAEAKNGEALQSDRLYLAPGDFHMTVAAKGPNQTIRLNQEPRENFCRPAVDPMLRSVAKAYGARVLAVILTGMGADGLDGGTEVVQAGGTVIAQDEPTSVVWGMPGAVATAGLCSAVLPLPELAGHIAKIVDGRAS